MDVILNLIYKEGADSPAPQPIAISAKNFSKGDRVEENKQLFCDLEDILENKTDIVDPIDYTVFADYTSLTLYDVGPDGEDSFFRTVKDIFIELKNKGYKPKVRNYPEEEDDGEILGAQATIEIR